MTEVAPQPPQPPRHSLVLAARTNLDSEPGWERGLTYAPETVGSYVALSVCRNGEVDNTREPEAVVAYEPWELQFVDPCDRVMGGYDRDEATARLRRVADATESYAIARELMLGELTRTDYPDDSGATDLRNASLTDGPTVLSQTPVSPRLALGMLQEAGGDALVGGQLYLHVPPIAEPFLPDLQVVGNLLYTRRQALVVSDAGYVNAQPGGDDAEPGTAWLYATGVVVVRRTPLQVDDLNDAQVVDHRTNRVVRRASKRVAATFDPAAHFAVPVTLS